MFQQIESTAATCHNPYFHDCKIGKSETFNFVVSTHHIFFFILKMIYLVVDFFLETQKCCRKVRFEPNLVDNSYFYHYSGAPVRKVLARLKWLKLVNRCVSISGLES